MHFQNNLDIEEIVKIYQKNKVEFTTIKLGQTTFSIEQILSMHEELKNNPIFRNGFGIQYKYKFSRRRSLIIILEESFFKVKEYPEDLDLSKYVKHAMIRFSFGNEEARTFNTAQKIHPKNPCQYYEDLPYPRRHYICALEDILETPALYFEIKQAIYTLQFKLEDLKK